MAPPAACPGKCLTIFILRTQNKTKPPGPISQPCLQREPWGLRSSLGWAARPGPAPWACCPRGLGSPLEPRSREEAQEWLFILFYFVANLETVRLGWGLFQNILRSAPER